MAKSRINKANLPVVVLGKSATALYAVRELGRAGIPVYCEYSKDSIPAYSRFVKPVKSKTGQTRVQVLLSFDFGEYSGKILLIPCSDQDLDFVYQNLGYLSKKYVVQESIYSGLAIDIMDKQSLRDLCVRHKVDIPGCWSSNHKKLKSLVHKINFPCLIKPALIHEVKAQMKGRKLWVAESIKEFENIVDTLPVGNTAWLVQEMIPGPESNIWLYCGYYDSGSKPHQEFTARKLRQFPPGFGSASLVYSEYNQTLKDLCSGFFNRIRYKGIAAAEFKLDPRDKKLKMIEVNPRPSLWFSISEASDKKICLAAYNDIACGRIIFDSPQLNGVCWRYWIKDFYSVLFYRFNKNFVLPAPETVVKIVSKKTGPVFCPDDIRPLFTEWLISIKKLFSRAFQNKEK